MNVDIIRETEFVPIWNDNKKEAEPITVVLQPLTTEQRENSVTLSFTEDNKVNTIPDYVKVVRYGVKEIKNLKVDKKAITTARELLESTGKRLDFLIKEIGTEIIMQNMRTDSKN